MGSFTIMRLTDHTGAEIVGLDFAQPIDTQSRTALSRAFAEHHVLVMRDQHFSAEQYKAAAQVFGELQQHDKKENHVPGHPDVYYISNDPRPPKATMLLAVELPSRGGDTQYVNMHDAYDDLSANTKRKIDGLKAV